MRYYTIMGEVGMTQSMGWLTPELEQKFTELLEAKDPANRMRIHHEIAVIRQNYQAKEAVITEEDIQDAKDITGPGHNTIN